MQTAKIQSNTGRGYHTKVVTAGGYENKSKKAGKGYDCAECRWSLECGQGFNMTIVPDIDKLCKQ